MTITPAKAVWPEPQLIIVGNSTSIWNYTRTIQSSTARACSATVQSKPAHKTKLGTDMYDSMQFLKYPSTGQKTSPAKPSRMAW